MKNIHILPTDKPSRLIIYSTLLNEFRLLDEPYDDWKHKRNIYITNDEEIKEGDWVLNISNNRIFKQDSSKPDAYTLIFWKKIILTTDQELIKDGVQAIDDEFLEWFVKNPSCEFVEVKKSFKANPKYNEQNQLFEKVGYWKYKIIIPSEEPKQECNCDNTCDRCAEKEKQQILQEAKEKAKQEILEEAAENRIKGINVDTGYRQQNNNLYNEIEVIELLQKALTHQDDGETGSLVTAQGEIRPANFFSWFERFKKK